MLTCHCMGGWGPDDLSNNLSWQRKRKLLSLRGGYTLRKARAEYNTLLGGLLNYLVPNSQWHMPANAQSLNYHPTYGSMGLNKTEWHHLTAQNRPMSTEQSPDAWWLEDAMKKSSVLSEASRDFPTMNSSLTEMRPFGKNNPENSCLTFSIFGWHTICWMSSKPRFSPQ